MPGGDVLLAEVEQTEELHLGKEMVAVTQVCETTDRRWEGD